MQEKGKLKTKDKKVTPAWYIAKRVIRAHGISYESLAEQLNCSVTSVHDFVNYTPNVLRIFQMAKATGIPFLDFFDLEALNAAIASGDSEAPAAAVGSVCRDIIATCPHCGTPLSVVLNELDD